jgi:hypothetical protein
VVDATGKTVWEEAEQKAFDADACRDDVLKVLQRIANERVNTLKAYLTLREGVEYELQPDGTWTKL